MLSAPAIFSSTASLLQELKAISIEDHCLEEIGSFFLLTQKVREVPLEVEGDSCEVKVPMRTAHRRSNSYGGPTLLPVPPKANLKKSRSIQSSAMNLAEGSRSRLSRSFWLVLHVLSQGTHQYVQLYFQRRYVTVHYDVQTYVCMYVCKYTYIRMYIVGYELTDIEICTPF